MILKSTIISVFVEALKKTFSIRGRASRRQFGLAVFAGFNLLLLIGNIIGIFKNFNLDVQISESGTFFFVGLPTLLLFIFSFTLIC